MIAFSYGYVDKDGVAREAYTARTTDIHHMARVLLKYKDEFLIDGWHNIIMRGERILTGVYIGDDNAYLAVWSDDRMERQALLDAVSKLGED